MAMITAPEPAVEVEPDSEALYEVVRGVRVELTPMGARLGHIANNLGYHLGDFVRSGQLGRAEVEMLFLIDEEEDTRRRPDVAFVSYDRWSKDRPVPAEAAWGVGPDLAIEVVSPTDRAETLLAKVREYFDRGVRAVWVIYPGERVVHLFDDFDTIRVLGGDGHIGGGDLLPGFRLALGSLFEG